MIHSIPLSIRKKKTPLKPYKYDLFHSILALFDHGTPLYMHGGIHTLVLVLRGHLGFPLQFSRGMPRKIWSKSMNLRGIFKEVLDSSGSCFLVCIKI
jgi:hypothetical protein